MQTKLHTPADDNLRDTVLRQIEWELQNLAQDIAVTAQEGTVTLAGFVHNYHDKRIAERAAKAVHGVRAVANDIHVKPSARTDAAIGRDVVEAMTIDVSVPDTEIKTVVKNGVVTLEGVVDRSSQRDAAAICASNVRGVRGVRNNISLKAAASPVDVKRRIDAALQRSARIGSRCIQVSASGGVVTLHGNVRSFAERDEAERAAWAAPGVVLVVDQICITP